jgi:hypothetical protein
MIAEIEENLAYGAIDFHYSKVMAALKPGHPADILDEILSIIGWDVFAGKTPEAEKIEQVLKELKGFKEEFRIKEVQKPIAALEEYLAPAKLLSFPIYIEGSRKSFLKYDVPAKEIRKIQKAMDEGYDFEDAPGLKTFYGKLMRAAKRKLNEDADLIFDDIDFDDLEYCVYYPENLEGEDNG